MLYVPEFVQLSNGSKNVVSHEYVSSSWTFTDLIINRVDGPRGLCSIVMLRI